MAFSMGKLLAVGIFSRILVANVVQVSACDDRSESIGLTSIGDGHQPNNRVFYTNYI